MAYLDIATSNNPLLDTHYSLTTSLDGRDYELRFDYAQEQDLWLFSVFTADIQPIVVGIPIVAGTNLLARCRDNRRPLGAFFLAPGRITPGLRQLGTEETLTYAESVDVTRVTAGTR